MDNKLDADYFENKLSEFATKEDILQCYKENLKMSNKNKIDHVEERV
jgi:hypothetical protein